MAKTVAVIGALDTKGQEFAFLKTEIEKRGCRTLVINVGVLDKLEGDTFTPDSLVASGVIKRLHAGLKILGNGEVTRKITVRANIYSKSALEKIQKAGGSAEILARKSTEPATEQK